MTSVAERRRALDEAPFSFSDDRQRRANTAIGCSSCLLYFFPASAHHDGRHFAATAPDYYAIGEPACRYYFQMPVIFHMTRDSILPATSIKTKRHFAPAPRAYGESPLDDAAPGRRHDSPLHLRFSPEASPLASFHTP